MLVLSLLLFSLSLQAQTVSDYYPLVVGSRYAYDTVDASGKVFIHEEVSIAQSQLGEFEGEVLFLVRSSTNYSISKKILSVTRDKIGIVILVDSTGREIDYAPYPIIFRLSGQWNNRSNNPSEYSEYVASNSPCTVGEKQYDDCIAVRETVYLNGKPFGIITHYYARGIGLVLETGVDSSGVPSKYIKCIVSYMP